MNNNNEYTKTLEELSTPASVTRLESERSRWAKETVQIEIIDNTCYTYGSEIACLRLYHKFNGQGRVFYSENLKTWVFAMD